MTTEVNKNNISELASSPQGRQHLAAIIHQLGKDNLRQMCFEMMVVIVQQQEALEALEDHLTEISEE